MSERLSYLFHRHLKGICSPPERTELMGLALEANEQDDLKSLISEAWRSTGEEEDITADRKEMIIKSILSGQATEAATGAITEVHKYKRANFNWRRIAVAASILLIIGLGTYFLWFKRVSPGSEGKELVTANDVPAPDKSRATITLADGRTIALDSLTTLTQNGVTLIKDAEGKLVYDSRLTTDDSRLVHNTLFNPRGSKVIDMQLSDGSHVWLNAGSSVTYPIAFIGKERKVTITGEAYLEVAHIAAMPFTLKKGNMEVTVLGTKFNVNAYDDEADIKVTLLEGSVKVSNGPATGMLKPGQQAQVTSDVKIVSNVDLEEVMAWKNGVFQLKATSIETIMRQIARWYDVDVQYEGGPVRQVFYGTIPRTVSAANVFKVLEETGGVHFRIEGRKVTVMP